MPRSYCDGMRSSPTPRWPFLYFSCSFIFQLEAAAIASSNLESVVASSSPLAKQITQRSRPSKDRSRWLESTRVGTVPSTQSSPSFFSFEVAPISRRDRLKQQQQQFQRPKQQEKKIGNNQTNTKRPLVSKGSQSLSGYRGRRYAANTRS